MGDVPRGVCALWQGIPRILSETRPERWCGGAEGDGRVGLPINKVGARRVVLRAYPLGVCTNSDMDRPGDPNTGWWVTGPVACPTDECAMEFNVTGQPGFFSGLSDRFGSCSPSVFVLVSLSAAYNRRLRLHVTMVMRKGAYFIGQLFLCWCAFGGGVVFSFFFCLSVVTVFPPVSLRLLRCGSRYLFRGLIMW